MPKKVLPLTDAAVRNAKPQAKAFKLSDGGGLYLEVLPSGGKSWRMKYRLNGQEKRIVFGLWPDVTLKQARQRRDAARSLVAGGIDPGASIKQEKAEARANAVTFEKVAREWLAKISPTWVDSHADKMTRRFEVELFPWLGALPIKDIKAAELLAVIRRIEARGAKDTARRMMQSTGQVFRYAVACGLAERDISVDLRGALQPRNVKHHASVTDPKEVARLLRFIENYTGSFVVRCALRLAPLVFLRPGELRKGEWSEIDFDKAEWRIPAERMKMNEQHLVPLSTQSLAILRELHPLTGAGKYIFPGRGSAAIPMSENTLNAALRYLGFEKREMTSHGFRSMASTLLNELGWLHDAIERQLAHGERDTVRAAYNFAQYLPERRKMMQAWADYLDTLKAGAKVTPLHATAGE
ncbi:MAG: integrase arm-type DNA-binding domain-containing protein [Solidesulfovibrio sp.]|uniref:tyrosine-type recombinase/integrase n=1 Tax=Solidesulfovibrio sp. TaxID=2910990 RepID=UPI002B1F8C53|nr:integrase arm-type DNA-binding domain-containing protein [Solidesulfovibrio sp.]MEA4858318.1 tyrosine-type recombinase/integrase [Solidesulfovibrio sp.]